MLFPPCSIPKQSKTFISSLHRINMGNQLLRHNRVYPFTILLLSEKLRMGILLRCSTIAVNMCRIARIIRYWNENSVSVFDSRHIQRFLFSLSTGCKSDRTNGRLTGHNTSSGFFFRWPTPRESSGNASSIHNAICICRRNASDATNSGVSLAEC